MRVFDGIELGQLSWMLRLFEDERILKSLIPGKRYMVLKWANTLGFIEMNDG